MIRIHKPRQAPAILREKGTQRRSAHSRSFTLHGARRFEFDRSIYGHHTVKEALLSAQHGKCCFCESKVRHVASGDVEHFRPKAAVRQSEDDPLDAPGYYWLAYDWSNLFFCCERCNRRHKANLFPLADPEKRVRRHHDARRIGVERPLFIDPGSEDPGRFMSFRRSSVYPIDDSERGKQTIRGLGLDRAALDENRHATLVPLGVCVEVLLGARRARVDDPDLVAAAALALARRTHDSAEYSAAVRCMLRAEFGDDRLRFPLASEELIAFAAGHDLPMY